MSLEPDFALRNTTVNQPRLSHSHSQQSIVASEDYYSVDGREGSISPTEYDPIQVYDHDHDHEHILPPRTRTGTTPPTRFHTPTDERLPVSFGPAQLIHIGPTAGPSAQTADPEHSHGAFDDATSPTSVTSQTSIMERATRRKPVPSWPSPPKSQRHSQAEPLLVEQHEDAQYYRPSAVNARAAQTASPALTDDISDQPYIEFALDQLTRDEEVRGSRRYPTRESVVRVGGDEVTVQHRTYAAAPAAVVATAPNSARSSARPISSLPSTLPVVSPVMPRDEIRQVFDDEPIDLDHIPESDAEQQRRALIEEPDLVYVEPRQRRATNVARDKELAIATIPPHPLHHQGQQINSPSTVSSHPREQYDVFIPYSPTAHSHLMPKLNFLPGILRPLWLGLYLLLCTLFLVGLIFSAAWSLIHNGLWDYFRFGDNRYFVFQYLPTFLGMILLLWLFQIQIAVQRIAPFIALASASGTRSQATFLKFYPTHFLLPNIQPFKAGLPIVGVAFVQFWLQIFTIPLLGSSFNVQYFNTTWRWVAVQGVMWTLVALFIIHIVTIIILALYLWRATTGLKWDPRSLADLIALLERANIMSDYANSETFVHISQFQQRLWNRSDRLGYWHTSRRPQDIFYGIGEEGGATRSYSIEQGRLREKAPRGGLHSTQSSLSSIVDIEAGAAETTRGAVPTNPDIRNKYVRRRYTPVWLKMIPLLVWILIAFALLLAFLVVAFVNHATIGGFIPQIAAAANTMGFSSANFLYSFVPGLIGMFLFLLFQPLDYTHRRLAPFVAMSKAPDGALAEHSLLLDYPFAMPVAVSVSSLTNGHFQVALLSFVSLANVAIPIIASGLFWAQWYPNQEQVRIAAHPSSLYALCFFLALYAFALLAALPNRKKLALPHDARCLSELFSWLYMSPLLIDRAFARCNSRAEMLARLMPAQPATTTTGENQHVNAARPTFLQSMASLISGRSSRSRVNVAGEGSSTGKTAFPRLSSDNRPSADESQLLPTSEKDNRLSTVPEDRSVRAKNRTAATTPTLGEKTRYGFGVFTGRDGREHLGIDRVSRDGRAMLFVGQSVRKHGREYRPVVMEGDEEEEFPAHGNATRGKGRGFRR